MHKMTANEDSVLSEILNRTVEYDPTTNTAWMHSLLAKKRLCVRDSNYEETLEIVDKFCAGSTAELRIKPMLSCFGDVDIMFHSTDNIVLTQNCQDLPTLKLKGMNSTLELYFMVSLPDYPGYANMRLGGLLSWSTQTNRYHLTTQKHQVVATLSNFVLGFPGTTRGPATNLNVGQIRSIINGQCSLTDLKNDFVKCLRCPCWPSEARDFIERPRSSGWPSSSLIWEVVGVGCDVVPVAHPDCRPHNKEQWRLLFSRGELILVRSWSKAQQILYHLLRFFIKNNLGSDNEIVSNYHLKTIMLWKCEEEDATFWNESQLIVIVSRLISCLVHHLNSQRLQHYFIAKCNLFCSRKVRNSRILCDQLTLKLIPFTAVEKLVDWFIENYLVAAYEKIPDRTVRGAFQWTPDVRSIVASVKSAVGIDRRRELFEELRISFMECYDNTRAARRNAELEHCFNLIMDEFRRDKGFILDHVQCKLFLGNLPQVDKRLVAIFRAVGILLLAKRLQDCHCLRLDSKIIDATIVLIGDSSDFEWVALCSAVRNDSPEAYFSKARYLLRHKKIAPCSEGLILTLAKTCLVKALEMSQPMPLFYDAASMYLATLLYMENQYQLVLDLCVSVASKASLILSNRCRVERELLPDCDSVSFASGFAFLFQYVLRKTIFMFYKHELHPSALDYSPTLLAYFLYAKVLTECDAGSIDTQLLVLVQSYCHFLRYTSPEVLSTCDFCLFGILLSYIRTLKGYSSTFERQHPKDSSAQFVRQNRTNTTVVYSRLEVSKEKTRRIRDNHVPSTSNSCIVGQCLSLLDWINQIDLLDIYIDCSVLYLSEEYRALSQFRRGKFSSALRICNEVLKLQNQQDRLHVFCSEPFTVLLDSDLKQIIDRKTALEKVTVHPDFLMRYLRLRCMLELQKSSREIALDLIELHQRKKLLVAAIAKGCVETEIATFIRQKVLTICTDICTEGEENLIVVEKDAHTTFTVVHKARGQYQIKVNVTTYSTTISSYSLAIP